MSADRKRAGPGKPVVEIWPKASRFGVEVAGHSIALYRRSDGALFATDNTHPRLCGLSDGWLDGRTDRGPLHAARFDVRTGKVLTPRRRRLKTYPVRVVRRGDQVKLD